MNTTPDNTTPLAGRFWQVFLALMGLGMLGGLAMIPTIIGQLGQLPPEIADMPPTVLVILSLFNIALLLAVAVASHAAAHVAFFIVNVIAGNM